MWRFLVFQGQPTHPPPPPHTGQEAGTSAADMKAACVRIGKAPDQLRAGYGGSCRYTAIVARNSAKKIYIL
jgi:hypothetical protein